MAETMAEILSPLFLPFVRQKYLSARQKTNTEQNSADKSSSTDVMDMRCVEEDKLDVGAMEVGKTTTSGGLGL